MDEGYHLDTDLALRAENVGACSRREEVTGEFFAS
jgi:hypothetical protein